MTQPSPSIIVAVDRNLGIGRANALPWHLPGDLAHFKRTTSGHAIVMGRKTYDSIGRPLPQRRNIVLTRDPAWQRAGVESAPSLPEALALAQADATQQVFVIGGAEVFALAMPLAQRLIVTHIDHVFDCDTFMAPIDPQLWQEQESVAQHDPASGLDYAFVTYLRRPG